MRVIVTAVKAVRQVAERGCLAALHEKRTARATRDLREHGTSFRQVPTRPLQQLVRPHACLCATDFDQPLAVRQ